MAIDLHHQPRLGIVVIGRNEGERLRSALQSARQEATTGIGRIVLYVDSGSTDGSLEVASSMGIPSHSLDPAQPFSAARARLEGAEQLIAQAPDLEFIQFLDGDCRLNGSWPQTAVHYLQRQPGAGVVCGKLEEEAPELSVFNRLNAIQWRGEPLGDVESCGGTLLIRARVYGDAGGFNPLLLTGEEADLCARVRAAGHRVVRIGTLMASHDSKLLTFGAWWRRIFWGGCGVALEYRIKAGDVSAARRKETRSVFLWGLLVPTLGIAGLLLSFWHPWFLALPACSLIGYGVLFSRVVRFRRRRGDTCTDATVYSFFTIIRKLPHAMGFLRRILTP